MQRTRDNQNLHNTYRRPVLALMDAYNSMNFLFFLLTRQTFINTPTINNTGIYFKGDADIISIADGNQRRQDYRIPKNSIGAQFKVKLADDSPLSIYVNRN